MSKLIFERRKENQTKDRLSELNESNDKDTSSFINKSIISESAFNVKEEYNTSLKDIDEYKKEIDRIFAEKKEKLDNVFKYDIGEEEEDLENTLNQKYEEELEKETKKEKEKIEEEYEKKKKK